LYNLDSIPRHTLQKHIKKGSEKLKRQETKPYKVVWLSGGVSSFIAGYIIKDSVDEWIYIDIADQHPDTLRFIKDCEKILNRKVTILRSTEYNSVEDVCRDRKFINSPSGAVCTGMLKKKVRKIWENQHLEYDLTYVWGFDCTEEKRAYNLCINFPEFNHEFPLIKQNLTKDDAHAISAKLGLKRPIMYDLGYTNNNCIGCVKGGMWYWNKIRVDFPEIFKNRAKLERDLNHSIIKGVYLDELDENAGRKQKEVMEECSIMCELTYNNL